MPEPIILFLKSMAPLLYSTEDFALKVRDDPKYDNNPLINKGAIDEAFELYGSVLNPSNRTNIASSIDYSINIEGHFLAAHLPEISCLVSNKTCTVEVLHKYLAKYDDVTHIGLSSYAIGLDNTIEVIKTIQKDYSHLILFVGGVGALYSHVQELVPQKNLCMGEGVNWLRTKFNLSPILRKEFIIPEIFNNFSRLPIPMKTYYMITQLGCPNSCDFCITPVIHNYTPYSNAEKIIQYFDHIYDKSNKDVFVFICDPNALYPERVWKKVFDHFIINHRQYDHNFFITCLTSLEHFSKFDLRKIQASPLKFFMINYGIESCLKQYPKNVGNPKKTVDLLNKLNMFTYHTFILGFPFHTLEGAKQEVAANLEYNSDRFFLTSFKPIPGTALYNCLKEEKRLLINDLPPEFVFAFEYMPFQHEHLGYGFDILKHCFYTYYETEKKEIDVMGRFATKLLNLCEHTSSRKLKRIASVFMNLSDANFINFKERMSDELVKKYKVQTNLNKEKLKRLKI